MKSLCLCVALLYFAPALNELYVGKRVRHKDKLRQRKHRKVVKQREREVKRQVKLAKSAARQKVVEEKQRLKDWQLRKHATAHQGTIDGFGAATPLDETQLKALSFSMRYRTAYLEAAAEKQQWLAAMSAQQNTPTVQPVVIKL
jgi:hypothetical protein